MNGEVMETIFDKFYELMRFMVTISIALAVFLFVVIFFAALFEEETYPVGSCPDYPYCSYQ